MTLHSFMACWLGTGNFVLVSILKIFYSWNSLETIFLCQENVLVQVRYQHDLIL
jgi:hypothetical protein